MDYNRYTNFTAAESKAHAFACMHELTDEDQLADELLHLALFTDGTCFQELYPELIERGIFYPGAIYRHADTSIAATLIQRIPAADTLQLNHLLVCLAWIGTENVVSFFRAATAEKPGWTTKLHVSPDQYAEEAGWTIDANGNKRTLFRDTVIVLTPDLNPSMEQAGITTFHPHSASCGFCNNTLTTVFRTAVDPAQPPVSFTTCLLCSCYQPLFMQADADGNSSWYAQKMKWNFLSPEMEMTAITPDCLHVSAELRKPAFSASQFVAISRSQLGGYPTWIQDSEYLSCPACHSKMDFIGQLDMSDVQTYGDGMYYFQYCPACKITGANYQQS